MCELLQSMAGRQEQTRSYTVALQGAVLDLREAGRARRAGRLGGRRARARLESLRGLVQVLNCSGPVLYCSGPG